MRARGWVGFGLFGLLTLVPMIAGAIIIHGKDAFQTKSFVINWKFRTPDGTLWQPGQRFSLKVQGLGRADEVGIIIICRKGLERGQVLGRLQDVRETDSKGHRFAELGLTSASQVNADRGVVTIRGSKATIEIRLPEVQ